MCLPDWKPGLRLLGWEAYALLFPLSETKAGRFPSGVAWWFFYFDTTHFLGRTFMSTDVVLMISTPFVLDGRN